VGEWYVGKVAELEEGGKIIIEVEGTKIGVYKKNGEFFSYKNVCKHQGGPACEGLTIGKVEAILADDKTLIEERFSEKETHIVCPWHGWEYNLRTGVSAGDKNVKCMSTYNSANDVQPGAEGFLQSMEALQKNGAFDSISDETVQQLFSSVLKLYLNKLNDNPEMQPFADHTGVTATEAVIAVTRILKQVNVEVFELAMWQTMGSIR
jgi:nitrite reductase (NADH) small subunit